MRRPPHRSSFRARRILRPPQRNWSSIAARLRLLNPSAEPVDSSDHPGVRDERMQRLEAVLLLAREPFPLRKLAQFANLADATQARTLIRRLNHLYDEERRAFRIEQVAGGYQLLTLAHLADWVRKGGHLPPQLRLSSPAMETLAVVAYRQPVLRAEIEAIRGVACGEMLRQLMDRDLVRIAGRSNELGRPYLYGTTNQFLQAYGLGDLEDLPRAAALQAALIPGDSPAKIIATQTETAATQEDASVSVTIQPELETETLEVTGAGLATLVAEQEPPMAGAEDDGELEEDDDWDDEDEDLDDDEEWDDDDDDLDDDFDDDDEDEDEDYEYDEEEDGEWEEVDDEDDDEEEDDDDEEEWDEDDEDDEDWDEEEDDED